MNSEDFIVPDWLIDDSVRRMAELLEARRRWRESFFALPVHSEPIEKSESPMLDLLEDEI